MPRAALDAVLYSAASAAAMRALLALVSSSTTIWSPAAIGTPMIAPMSPRLRDRAAQARDRCTRALPAAEVDVSYRGVLACCATGVALNSVTPAHAGTLVTTLMLVAIIPTATLTGVLAAAAVEKLFFAVVGLLVYVYLFLAVGGSFERKFGVVSRHPWALAIVVVGGAAVVIVAGRLASRWLRRRWEEARAGGRILSDKRAYARYVVVPQLLSWSCKVGVVAVLLAAYGIPVGFHTILSVVGGNALANVASLTPGGVGISQAFNVASLHDATSAATASAYSIGQQLLTTVWNIVLAVVLVAAAFGRTGGKRLVEESSARARELQAEPRGSA